MRAASDSFFAALRGSHRVISRARLVAPLQSGILPTGLALNPLDGPSSGADTGLLAIVSGDVVSDITADITSTLNLTVKAQWPATAAAPVTPYGQEIYVENGVVYGNGTTEYVGLGYFRINSVEQEDTPAGSLAITAEDRMANIRDARPVVAVEFGAGASVQAVIDFLVGEVLPGVPIVYDWNAAADLLATTHIMTDDRLGFIKALITSRAKVMFFDYAGRLQIKSAADPKKGSVYTVNHGRGGVLVNMKRGISRDAVYNAVVASGDAAGENPPVRGVAFDESPTSPTRWGGPFGKVPRFFSSTFLQTDDQCRAAAQSLLSKAVGLPYTVSLSSASNPALESGDVITVSYGDAYPSETHICDRITYGLTPGNSMDIDTRKQFL